MLFEIASKNKVSSTVKISLPSLKINVYLYGETGVGKTKLAKEMGKACKKRYIQALIKYGM